MHRITEELIQEATERAGSPVLGALLARTVTQFLTPIDDPLYDWQIVTLSEVKKAVEERDATGKIWRTVPDTVQTRNFVAPAKQCALAWGTRMVSGRNEPTPLAVLVWATRDESGNVVPVVGASFYYSQDGATGPRWFTRDQVDPHTGDAVCAYLNGLTASVAQSNLQGVDLE